MQESQFDRTLKALKEKPLPEAPLIEGTVLQAIRMQDSDAEQHFGLNWFESLLAPRFAAACLALTLIFSATITSVSFSAYKEKKAYSQTAARALGFDTFQAPDLLALNSPSRW